MTESIVTLCEYSPDWEKQFTYEKKKILKMLDDKIVRIEHIGSTSIKGMRAKPIIDIMVGVKDLEKVSEVVEPLKEIEYEYVPKPEFKDRRFFRKGRWGRGICHLHVCEINRTEWLEKLWFRDYLRKKPEVATEYAKLKTNLASKYMDNRSKYTEEKGPFIRMIVEKAKLEYENKEEVY